MIGVIVKIKVNIHYLKTNLKYLISLTNLSGGYAYLLWKKKKSCLKRKRTRKQTEEEGKLRQMRKEDYRSKVFLKALFQ